MKQLIIIMLLGLALSLTGCSAAPQPGFDVETITSYRDIPGVTEDEIAAIEALKASRGGFIYGVTTETESFILPDGTYGGFTAKFCELLSGLFETDFSLQFYEWEDLIKGLDQGEIDFNGDLTATPERQRQYYMSHAIAERSLRIFTPAGSQRIMTELDIEGLNIGVLAGTITADYIKNAYPVNFNAVETTNTINAVYKLMIGEIDAFVLESIIDPVFADYEFIRSREFFPLVYTPVSLTTTQAELAPIISVIDKYIVAGGIDKLYQLYREGDSQYAQYRLRRSFSAEEEAYLDELLHSGATIKVAMEPGNYPYSFYNETDKEFQGIAPDVLAQISRLTGIRFAAANTKAASWPDLMQKLQNGEAAMITQLLKNEQRQDSFIWAATPYDTSNYALLSRSDFPNLAIYQVINTKVGYTGQSAYEDIYHEWFPDGQNGRAYDSAVECFDALENGEIDLVMASEDLLLMQLNYREKTGFKVNILFNNPVDSYFGFNKNQELLCSIVGKAQNYVNTAAISRDWGSRVYDYSAKLARQSAQYMTILAGILTTALFVLSLLLWKNNRLFIESKQLAQQEQTLRRETLAAQEDSRLKSAFLAHMSHEIRTPMNSIIGFSELILDESISPTARDYLDKIKSSSEMLLRIINDILDISKIQAGRMELESIPFDMHEVFQACQSVIAPKAKEKGITLYCYAEPSVGKRLLGDPTRLRQALLNLLANAVKFTNTGMVKLLSDIEHSTEESVTIRFEIKDSGIGMTPEQLEKVFDPFIQADQSTTRRYGGTGLGLPITRDIVEQMGGRIEVESAPGVGSKFSFTLTFKTIDAPAAAPKRESQAGPYQKPLFAGEVLLCEDNQLNQQVVTEHLTRVGLNVTIAVNGAEGVAQVRGREQRGEPPFGLIFMDIHMPVMDGLEAAAKLMEGGCQTPIVALTANVMTDDRQTYRENGMDDYLAKPFTAQELWACLLRYFNPLAITGVKEAAQSAEDEKLRRKLIGNFVADYTNAPVEIENALAAGDIELAHRQAHSLKTVAALVGRDSLSEAARALEQELKQGEAGDHTKPLRQTLAGEMEAAIAALTPLIPQAASTPTRELDKEKALALLQQTEELLNASDSDCLQLTESLKNIAGTALLIRQIEEYDFQPALITLAGLRRSLEQ